MVRGAALFGGPLSLWGIITRMIKKMTPMNISAHQTPLNKLMEQTMKITSSFIPAVCHWIFWATKQKNAIYMCTHISFIQNFKIHTNKNKHVFSPSCFILLGFDCLLFIHYEQQNIHAISTHMAVVIGHAPLSKP